MNRIILLSIIFGFFQSQANTAKSRESVSSTIPKLKEKVDSAIDTLNQLSSDISNIENTSNKLNTIELENINHVVKKKIQKYEKQIALEKLTRMDIGDCLESGKNYAADVNRTAFSDIEKCSNRRLSTAVFLKQGIESAIVDGKQLISKLDVIASHCAQTSEKNMQIYCIARRMPAQIISVKKYERNVNNLKTLVLDNSLKPLKKSLDRCIGGVWKSFYKSIDQLENVIDMCRDTF